jgi:hypothetical protein
MKVLVCGSRDWTDREAIQAAIARYGPSVEIIHGNARGADLLAVDVALFLGLPCVGFPADWDRHGRRAGILRNLEMLDERPDLVMAFQVGASRGTQHTIDEALRRGISVEVHRA